MPNGWKKNAKYFNHGEMSHKEYVQKKNKLREWKKKQEKKDNFSFVDSKKVYDRYDVSEGCYGTNDAYGGISHLTQEEKSGITFYMSKQRVKKSNGTFKKESEGRWWINKPLFKTKKNCNKYTRFTKKSHKVYFKEHKKNEIKPLHEKQIAKEHMKHECSICCEQEVVSKLFTVYCRRKGIGSFNKNSDKVVCNSCREKLDYCPYCRSHKLICTPYKSNIKKKVKKSSLEQQKRKNKMKTVKKLICQNSMLKAALKKKYPNTILCHKNGRMQHFDSIEKAERYEYKVLPLKLYKYYSNYFKNCWDIDLHYTTYDKADHDVVMAYAGFKEGSNILESSDVDEYSSDESEDDNDIFGVPDYVNSNSNYGDQLQEETNDEEDEDSVDYYSISREEFMDHLTGARDTSESDRERESREQAIEEMENILDDMIDFGF